MKTKTDLKSNKVTWVQGLMISLGVPLLVLPSISYFNNYIAGFAVVVWFLSVMQGFAQNLAYAELASMYPQMSGIPGFVQAVFSTEKAGSKTSGFGKFLGGFTAWSYWFAWNPVLAIFTLLIGDYLNGLIPAFSNIPPQIISIAAGIIIYGLLILANLKGLKGGAVLGYFFAAIAIIPLLTLAILPMITGHFQIQNFTLHLFPEGWAWNIHTIGIFAGIMAMAQWSACAWETAALYAPEYANPKKDIPKSLFTCGAVCLFSFVLVQVSCVGTLGVQGITDSKYSPMLLLAKTVLGNAGAGIAIFMLIASMVLIIQTAFLGSSKALQSMAEEKNLPEYLGRTNKQGVPIFAMIIIAVLNLLLIGLKTPSLILAASALGYVIANGISLFAFWKTHKSDAFKNIEKTFSAPRIWKYVALTFGVINIPVYLVGIIMININDFGIASSLLGVAVLLLYVVIWIILRYKKRIQN